MGEIVSLARRSAVPQQGHAPARRRSRRQFGKLRKLPSKRWQASYLGPDGARHTAPTTFQTKGDAEAWLSMQQASIVEHRWKPAPPVAVTLPTLGVHAESWLASRELKPRTRAEYRRMLDAKILPALAAVPLDQLSAADVRAWYAKLDPQHPTARAHAFSLLRVIMAAAVDDELISVNPCRIPGGGSTKRAAAIRPASIDELAHLTQAMPAKYRLMVLLASWCALRYGELAELRRGDIDLVHGVLRIRRAVTWPDGVPTVGTPKSDAGSRDVHVPPHLLGTMAEHIVDHAAPGPDGLMFPNANGDHLHHGSLYKVFKPARVAAGRPDLRWHDLRHTGAVLAAQSGATLAELMGRLGHSTVGAALRYQHASQERDAEIARRLSAMAERTIR